MAVDRSVSDIYLTHRGRLLDYASGILGDRSQAEDVVQEAYLRFDAAAGRRTVADPLPYLYRIVRNLALDWKRLTSAEERRDRARMAILASAPSTPSPEDGAIYLDQLRVVEAALNELPDNVRQAYEMHRLDGCTFQQIADHLDVSVATAARWARRALLHIGKRLRDAG